MVKIVTAIIVCAFCSGCDEVPLNLAIRNGTYVGTFTIRQPDGTEQSGGVTFIFNGERYSCFPEKYYLPPSGAGTCYSRGNTVTLTDNVAHTAEFDWTLILGGDFNFSFDGKTLTLTQNDTKYNRYRTIILTYQNP